MTSGDGHGDHEELLERLQEGDRVPVSEKRGHLRDIAKEFKQGIGAVLPESVMPLIRVLAEDDDWQVRQDVAEMLVYVPEGDFAQLAGRLVGDPNGYVRRSAEKSRERRRKAEREAKRASRGLEQVATEYENLTKQVGGEVADKAIALAEKRFTLLSDALLHDLLQIVGSVKSAARALRKGLANGDAVLLETAKGLSQDVDYIEQYMRAFEAYAKTLPPQRHMERIAEVVRRGTERAQEALRLQGFDLAQVTLDDSGLAEIRAEVSLELVAQAVANIVTNAYEAMLNDDDEIQEGKITISAHEAEGMVAIEVCDDGCGLSPDELTALRAFLPGRKNPRKPRSKGLGLLAAKKNIEAHDGSLAVESTLGEGTTVTIALPLTAEEGDDGQSPGS